MPNEPWWIEVEDVIEINQAEVAETGEPFGLRDLAGLESAVARPRSIWDYEPRRGQDIVVLMTALISSLARNHPFEQGNKRTALTAGLDFALANGYRLEIQDDLLLGVWVTALVTREFSEAEFAEVVRPYLVPWEGD